MTKEGRGFRVRGAIYKDGLYCLRLDAVNPHLGLPFGGASELKRACAHGTTTLSRWTEREAVVLWEDVPHAPDDDSGYVRLTGRG
ncbi:hypothetical protein ACIO3O_41850 [Streptomyces sp. NPDC087440]|uniref:hypothetical protein n=1 Tax=Streptomyces sp. NPDC087440 TaxID=3365790 RepID=UPI0038159032